MNTRALARLLAGVVAASICVAAWADEPDGDRARESVDRAAIQKLVEQLKVQPRPYAAAPGGTRYCIRIYPLGSIEGAGSSQAAPFETNPAILDDGVLGYSVQLVSPSTPSLGTDWQPDKPAEPAAQPEKPKTPPAPPAPTLDDLLGTKPKAPTQAPKVDPAQPEAPKTGANAEPPIALPDQDKKDLDRLLSAAEMGDAFKQAVTLMGDASQRLVNHRDPGLETQRVQEDIIRRLDQLIASMDKQKQPQPKPDPQQQKDPKQSPPKQGPKKPQDSQPQPEQGDGLQEHAGPTLKEGKLAPELESARAAWGALPQRVRDMLMQGTEDRFSARYKALTQEYYKRLAEENSK